MLPDRPDDACDGQVIRGGDPVVGVRRWSGVVVPEPIPKSAEMHPPRGRRPVLRSREQGGFALFEVVVGVALISLLFGALAGAVLMTIRVSGDTAERQRLQTELGNFAERLKAVPYTACAETSDYQTVAAYSPSPGSAVSISRIEYWERTSPGGGSGRWVTARCAAASADQGAQRLTIAGSRGDQALELQLVKGAR